MKPIKAVGITLLVASCLAGSVQAKEGGDQYPNGGENWMAGAVPPPGDYFINYLGHYSGKLRDGNGNKVDDAKVDAWFNAFRYVNVTEHKILGGNWGWHVIAPVVNQRIRLGGGSDTVTGLRSSTVKILSC